MFVSCRKRRRVFEELKAFDGSGYVLQEALHQTRFVYGLNALGQSELQIRGSCCKNNVLSTILSHEMHRLSKLGPRCSVVSIIELVC